MAGARLVSSRRTRTEPTHRATLTGNQLPQHEFATEDALRKRVLKLLPDRACQRARCAPTTNVRQTGVRFRYPASARSFHQTIEIHLRFIIALATQPREDALYFDQTRGDRREFEEDRRSIIPES